VNIVSVYRERRYLKPIMSDEYSIGSVKLKAGIKPATEHEHIQQTDWP
jgi:hypothetical protein